MKITFEFNDNEKKMVSFLVHKLIPYIPYFEQDETVKLKYINKRSISNVISINDFFYRFSIEEEKKECNTL